VFLNDVLLGVIMESGLTSRYRWAVSMKSSRPKGDRVRIDAATAEQLAHAKAAREAKMQEERRRTVGLRLSATKAELDAAEDRRRLLHLPLSAAEVDVEAAEAKAARVAAGDVCFMEAADHITLSERDAVATKTSSSGYNLEFSTAAGAVLASGTHYATFTLNTLDHVMYVGLVTDDCDVRRGKNAHYQAGNVFFSTHTGRRYSDGRTDGRTDAMPGRHGGAKRGDRVGLIFDTATGTLTVCLNDVELGAIADRCLLRERYRWAVSMHIEGASVRLVRSNPLAPSLRGSGAPSPGRASANIEHDMGMGRATQSFPPCLASLHTLAVR
jgi:hypothetical protein